MSDATTTQADLDKVIARIQKLYALAGRGGHRGGTEAEADTAIKEAQRLLVKHNLDEAAVEAARPAGGGSAPVERVKDEVGSKTRYKWQRDLAKYVAEAHFCYYVLKTERDWSSYDGDRRPPKRSTHVFVGRKGNVLTAKLMFDYLVESIERLAPTEDRRVVVGRTGWAEYKGETYRIRIVEVDGQVRYRRCDARDAESTYGTPSEAGRAITGQPTNGFKFFGLGEASTAESWKQGCADRICERLAKRREDLVAEHDARAKQAEEDARAERRRRADEARAASERVLEPCEGAEVDARIGGLRATARPAPVPATGLEAERPEEREDGWSPGAGAEAAPEAPTSTALVLASAYDESEREANYELAHGMEPGALARRRREQEERQRQWEAGRAEREAAREAAAREEPVRVETEKEKARREKRETEEWVRTRRRWARESERDARRAEREHAKVDHRAYREGQERGGEIGLDAQVASSGGPKRLGGGK